MDELTTELGSLLLELERSPHQGALRLRAAVLANRISTLRRDPFLADVAEALAEEEAPGATRALRASLAEQASLARQVRRLIAGSGATGDSPSTTEADVSVSA